MKTNIALVTFMLTCFALAQAIKPKTATSPNYIKNEKETVIKMTKKTTLSLYEIRNKIAKYDERIVAAVRDARVATFKEGSKATFIGDTKLGKVTVEDFKKESAARIQSIEALMENRNKLKATLVLANATNDIEVAGKKYTISEAIERQEYVKKEIQYWASVNQAYLDNKALVSRKNSAVEDKLTAEKESKVRDIKNTDALRTVTEQTQTFYDENKFNYIVEGIEWEKFYNEKVKELKDFDDTVKTQLMLVNCNTKIEVELKEE